MERVVCYPLLSNVTDGGRWTMSHLPPSPVRHRRCSFFHHLSLLVDGPEAPLVLGSCAAPLTRARALAHDGGVPCGGVASDRDIPGQKLWGTGQPPVLA